MSEEVTAAEFANLAPRGRGYHVYMAGARLDQPNIPNEKNPYTKGSRAHQEWDLGQRIAVLEAQDDP